MTDDQLTALLRLKRYEKPDPAYFEDLLKDIQERQRAELLHRPIWKLAMDRFQTFFSEHSMGNVSYATAMASVLVAGVSAIVVLTPGEIEPRETFASQSAAKASARGKVQRLLSLEAIGPALPSAFERQTVSAPGLAPGNARRYVIDARPVSYEPEPSTRF